MDQYLTSLIAHIDRVDLNAAKTFGLDVVRVPAYSPYAVAEVRNIVSFYTIINKCIPITLLTSIT